MGFPRIEFVRSREVLTRVLSNPREVGRVFHDSVRERGLDFVGNSPSSPSFESRGILLAGGFEEGVSSTGGSIRCELIGLDEFKSFDGKLSIEGK